MDIVDVYTELNKKFPHVKFIIEEKERGHLSFYYFKLIGLFNLKFDPAIKTSICILRSDYITDLEYQVIERKMYESFSVKKLLGV